VRNRHRLRRDAAGAPYYKPGTPDDADDTFCENAKVPIVLNPICSITEWLSAGVAV
jgi:hypothetical protein